jgi:type IV fimbrial biogenesis protein FimT
MELLIVVTIVGILLAIGVPSLRDLILKNRLRGAAEEAQSMLQFARSEAVKRNEDVTVTIDEGDPPPWCFGAAVSDPATNPNCDCTTTTSCVLAIAGTNVLKRVSSVDYRGVTLDSNLHSDEVEYDHRRGLTTDAGTLFFKNGRFEIRVVVGPLGRVRMCSPSGTTKVLGYDDC